MRDWINESVYRRLAFALVAVLSLSAGVGLVIAAVWHPGWPDGVRRRWSWSA